MNDVKWIKLYTDMFDNSKVRQLRSLAGGNDIVLIWVMLLVLAGKCNAGGMIILMEHVPYTVSMLSTELGFTETQVSMAINALISFGMIANEDGVFAIKNWGEYQNIDGMDKIREQNRLRKQKQRERERLEIEDKSDEAGGENMSRDSHVKMSRFCSYSYSNNSNINNLKHILSNESDYKNKDYINNNIYLYNSICDWMAYKDEKTPKKDNHYGTKMGLTKTLTEIVNHDMELGTDVVIAVIDECISKNWKGIIWEIADRVQIKRKPKRTEVKPPKQEKINLWKDEWDDESENAI